MDNVHHVTGSSTGWWYIQSLSTKSVLGITPSSDTGRLQRYTINGGNTEPDQMQG